MKVRRIVYCTDFSPQADQAFAQARALATERDAHLFVINVLPAGDEFAAAGFESTMRHRDRVSARLRERYLSEMGDTAAEAIIRRGPVARTVLDLAKEKSADLIVVGARGQGAISGLLGGGSTTSKIVKNSPIPVLVVPERGTTR